MIAMWMAYAAVVAGMFCVAGAALDRLLRAHRLPVRWVWLAVLTAGSAFPLFQLLGNGSAAPVQTEVPAEGIAIAMEAIRLTVGTDSPLRSLDPLLLVTWGLFSVALLATVIHATLRLRKMLLGWERRRIADSEVCVTSDVGPAVLGLIGPSILIPTWMVDGDARTLELTLAHEEEHVRARDPLLVAIGAAFLLTSAWNPFLWLAFRRLQEAVEVDCDARVLARRVDSTREYADTLLAVKARGARRPALSTAFSHSSSFLERRVRAMTASRPGRPVPRAVLLLTVTSIAVTAACLTPSAAEERGDGVSLGGAPPSSAVPPPASEPVRLARAPDITNAQEVIAALREVYPSALRDAGIGGASEVWIYTTEEGATLDTRIRESTGHPDLDAAALEVAQVFEFTPPATREGPVAAWISIPIIFEQEG